MKMFNFAQETNDQTIINMKRTAFILACLMTAGIALAKCHWVGTWGTAPQ